MDLKRIVHQHDGAKRRRLNEAPMSMTSQCSVALEPQDPKFPSPPLPFQAHYDAFPGNQNPSIVYNCDASSGIQALQACHLHLHGSPRVGSLEVVNGFSVASTSWPCNRSQPPSRDPHLALDALTSPGAYSQSSLVDPPRPEQHVVQDNTPSLPTILGEDETKRITNDLDLYYESEADKEMPEVVCYGRVTGIAGRCEQPGLCNSAALFPVMIESLDRFRSTSLPELQGRILSEHGQMISNLLEEQGLYLYASCTLSGEPMAEKPSRTPLQLPCHLDITVYGPPDLFDDIGGWFQEYDVYLQDPLVCHMDVKYFNPHKLSSEHLKLCPLVSEIVSRPSGLVSLQALTKQTDLLDTLNSNTQLEETTQPTAIRTALKKHQGQALTFMRYREQGWDFSGKHTDIWECVETDRGEVFVNRVSGSHQVTEPPQFRGGVIADPMGLGKTLTMIALVATDIDGGNNFEIEFNANNSDIGKASVSATLIVIPPPLMGTWEEQLSEHVVKGRFKCRRNHGKSRLAEIDELNDVNVVLTTYHTVSAEHKAGSEGKKSVLFSVRWRRIILDEAHFIRNGSSRMANAVCALDSMSRWAVTGTPVQNRLSDLATLCRFVRVHPYTDPRQFEVDISRLWKSGQDEEAVKRLQRLSACLLLRRPQGTIKLLPRKDMKCPIHFSPEEKAVYDKMKEQTIIQIDEALCNGSDAARPGVYSNVLQQIESLRLFCNLGLHYDTRHDKSQLTHSKPGEWSRSAQHTFDLQRQMGPMMCLQCSSMLEVTETALDDLSIAASSPIYFRCLKYICSDCSSKIDRSKRQVACGHKPTCAAAPVSTSNSALEEVTEMRPLESGTPDSPVYGLPSKVKALIADLKTLPSDIKCVVFSTWRLTLDIIEQGLNQASIQSIRFDGMVPQKERPSVVNRFKKDPSIQVMLLTLSCGAVGLTLTVASRAYLMEPHWNPTLEEQALARVYRIGQTREVTTVRFHVQDSFEEQVMEIQQSKKELAGILLSPHDRENGSDSLGALHRLRSLLA